MIEVVEQSVGFGSHFPASASETVVVLDIGEIDGLPGQRELVDMVAQLWR